MSYKLGSQTPEHPPLLVGITKSPLQWLKGFPIRVAMAALFVVLVPFGSLILLGILVFGNITKNKQENVVTQKEDQ